MRLRGDAIEAPAHRGRRFCFREASSGGRLTFRPAFRNWLRQPLRFPDRAIQPLGKGAHIAGALFVWTLTPHRLKPVNSWKPAAPSH
jgi:hypothetical protein